MDVFDRAHATEQRDRDRAVRVAIAKAQPKGHGSDTCICCGEPIPEGRRRAAPHANACLECQAELEEKLGR